MRRHGATLVLTGALLAPGLAPARAEEPSLVAARLSHRAAAGAAAAASVEGTARDLGEGWIGWFAAARPGLDRLCCDGSCRLAGSSWGSHRWQAPWPVTDRLMILVEVRGGALREARAYHQGCAVEAEGASVVWLDGLDEERGLELLAGLEADHGAGGLAAVAFHANPAATATLLEAARTSSAEDRRHAAIFWLGEARGDEGVEALERLLGADLSAETRKHAAFAFSVSQAAGAAPALLALARRDPSPEVRSAGLFWIAQRGGPEAEEVLEEALRDDPSAEVREQTVFAASQLDDGRGTDLLLGIVRGEYPLATKKQALFWLGQSDDPRALEEIRELLHR